MSRRVHFGNGGSSPPTVSPPHPSRRRADGFSFLIRVTLDIEPEDIPIRDRVNAELARMDLEDIPNENPDS